MAPLAFFGSLAFLSILWLPWTACSHCWLPWLPCVESFLLVGGTLNNPIANDQQPIALVRHGMRDIRQGLRHRKLVIVWINKIWWFPKHVDVSMFRMITIWETSVILKTTVSFCSKASRYPRNVILPTDRDCPNISQIEITMFVCFVVSFQFPLVCGGSSFHRN